MSLASRLPGLSAERLVGASLILLVAFMGAVFLVVALRGREGTGTAGPPKPSPARSRDEAYQRVHESRKRLVEDLISALEHAAAGNEARRLSEFADALAREGPEAVPSVLSALKARRGWNLDVALLGILGRIGGEAALSALVDFFRTLQPTDLAYKLEIVKVLSRAGGGLSRDRLRDLLAGEKDPEVREAIVKTLVALGMTREEAARIEARDREMLEGKIAERVSIKGRAEAIEKLDPASPEGLGALRRAALEEGTIAVALLAFRKLEARGDGPAVEALSERARRKAESDEARIIQTNALAALARMRASEARLAIRQFALGEESDLRVQAIELVGGFGDEAMVPLLEQAGKKYGDQATARSAREAVESILSRAAARK